MERVDKLTANGYKILQDTDGFCFGMDAVLLSRFAKVSAGETVLDLCTGTGVVPLLLAAHTQGSHFTGLEIQERVADMAGRSVKLNHVEDRVSIVCGDLKEAAKHFPKASFDVVTCNPPYMSPQGGLVNPSDGKAISRHEIKCTLADVVAAATQMLRSGGRFYMVHRPRRLPEIFALCEENNLHIRTLRTVQPRLGEPANMVLVEAIRGGNAQCNIAPTCVIYEGKDAAGKDVYTDEIRRYFEE